MSCLCLSPSDTNFTLRQTLAFLQVHQTTKEGAPLELTLFLSTSLLKNQLAGSDTPRELAFFVLSGFITQVTDTTVELIAHTSCEKKYATFTILITDIVTLTHDALSIYCDAYLDYMSNLPSLCHIDYDKSFQILTRLSTTLKTYRYSTMKELSLIYNGICSEKKLPRHYRLVKNLILISAVRIIPITQLDGFFMTPVCTKSES